MQLVSQTISLDKLRQLARKKFGNLVKAVVDVNRAVMVVDAELHADEEALLLQRGSKQSDLWGINLYPEINGQDWIEFDSMINLRPSQNNLSRGVDDPKIKQKLVAVVNKLVNR